MWTQAFTELAGPGTPVSSRLLSNRIHIGAHRDTISLDLATRASCILATRPLRHNERRLLIIQRPAAAPSEARSIILTLLFAEFASPTSLESDLVHISSPLLFVTQEVVKCRKLLESVQIGKGQNAVQLGEAYRILPITRRLDRTQHHVLYVANPGRSSAFASLEPFGAVVVDASHPRTMAHLGSLLCCPSVSASGLVVVCSPPIDPPGVISNDFILWLWTPESISTLEDVLVGQSCSPLHPDRHYWLARDDEVEELLHSLHQCLAGAMPLCSGRPPRSLLVVWRLYHFFRQLCVPLELMERERWLTVREELQMLRHLDPPGSGDIATYLDLHWDRMLQCLAQLYDVFAHRHEPDKFYAVAELFQKHFEDNDEPIRVVTATARGAEILEDRLHELVDDFATLTKGGAVEFIHQREEARAVAEGRQCETVLMGARTSSNRYLDLYPQKPLHIITYEYEARADQSMHEALMNAAAVRAGAEAKTVALERLHMAVQHTKHPHSEVRTTAAIREHHVGTRRQTRIQQVQPEPLDVKWVGAAALGQESLTPSLDELQLSIDATVGWVEVLDVDQQVFRYPQNQRVDVYYPATRQLNRVEAGSLRPGDYLIVLLDDHYETLFDRLKQAIARERPKTETARLERWFAAKRLLLRSHGYSKSRIYEALTPDLTVGYQALIRWFGEDDSPTEAEGLAPGYYHDFALVARLTGVYSNDDDIRATFRAIEHERKNRRRLGRALHRALVSIADGSSYETAVRTAGILNTLVDDIFLATDMREIAQVQLIQHER